MSDPGFDCRDVVNQIITGNHNRGGEKQAPDDIQKDGA